MPKIFTIIENEISNYISGQIPISEGFSFSQYKLVRRIMIYSNQIYPSGKLDSQKNYKYWFDIISSRIDAEVKNVDFDTSDILLYSDSTKDTLGIFLAQARLKEWMRETGQATKLNDAIEESTGWGNTVWKKTKDGYHTVDLNNFYVVNQTAKTLDETPTIERHVLTQSQMRAKAGIWKNVEEAIKSCGNKDFAVTKDANPETKETPYYEIYERNGEISEAALLKAQGKEGGKEDKYILAKIIVVGLKEGGKDNARYVLFADKIPEMPYKEYHRGRYTGRWFRKGLYEILFDIQTRANEIGNQIARGLEWSSKTIFRSDDKLIAQNILTDMMNGDIVKSADLQQVATEMRGLTELVADWNNLMKLADQLCNSYEIVQGQTMPSGTPFRLGALLSQNANKLFDFIREKLALAVQAVLETWMLPDLIKDLKKKDILRLTGDPSYLKRYNEMVINGWYLKNLIALGPHSPEQAEALKQQKLAEIEKRPEALIKMQKDLWKGIKPRAQVIITGENVNQMAELETIHSFIQLEQDPVRRQALIEKAMHIKGIDIEGLPKSSPEALQGATAQGGQPGGGELERLRDTVGEALAL